MIFAFHLDTQRGVPVYRQIMTTIFKTLLAACLIAMAAYSQPAPQNPMTVNIRPSTLDVAATKVRLLAIPEHADKAKEIMADDEQALTPIVPYSVLIKNESDRKLKAVGVRFRWPNDKKVPPTKSLILMLTMMMHAEDPTQLAPGGHLLFTPVSVINQYLALAPEDRKKGYFQTSSRPSAAPPGSSSIGQQLAYPSLAETMQQGLGRFGIQSTSEFEALLEGVVFEDYSYVGSEQLFQSLLRYNNLIHR